MYKRTTKFEDFLGNQRTEDFFFHLNKAEIIQWLTCNGGYTLDQQLQRLYETSCGKDIMDIFDDLLHRSYGKPSLDGRRFDKSEELWLDFRATEAYSIIFTELVSDAKKAAAFINAIVPKSMSEEINKIMESNIDGIPEEMRDYLTNDMLDENGNLVPPPKKEESATAVTTTTVSNVTPISDGTQSV